MAMAFCAVLGGMAVLARAGSVLQQPLSPLEDCSMGSCWFLNADVNVADAPDSGQVGVEYESAEHNELGQTLLLRLSDDNLALGSENIFAVGDTNISFAQLIPLADLYGNWKCFESCPQQISDPELSDKERQQLFRKLYDQVRCPEQTQLLTSLVDLFTSQKTEISGTEDPAQLYNDKNGALLTGWDTQYFYASSGAYLQIALCNWDHFGEDAITAYKVGHSAALEMAKEAKEELDLKNGAYFMEGIAQHFLSDMFSAGHLRAPRRMLHTDPSEFSVFDQSPGDQCNRLMHDEDCANGLWVRNAYGDGWAVYGDKQLFANKSLPNRQQAYFAMQEGLDEIYEMYTNRTVEEPFKPLKRVPIVQEQNFTPLFRKKNETELYQRKNVQGRGDLNTIEYSISGKKEQWLDIFNGIKDSPAVTKMYPRTIQKANPTANITQLRQINDTHFLINDYGPVWTNHYPTSAGIPDERSWNMIDQLVVPFAPGRPVQWAWVQNIKADVYSLIGFDGQDGVHLGFSKGYLLWNVTRGTCPGGVYTYGVRSSGSNMPALVRRCNDRFELWTQEYLSSTPELTQKWPAQQKKQWNLVVEDAFVSIVYESDAYHWESTLWSDDFSKMTQSSFVEPNIEVADAIFTGKLFGDAEMLVRISSVDTQVIIDSILLSGNTTLTVHDAFTFNATGYDWFLMDVNRDGNLDLIGLQNDGFTIKVAAFPNLGPKKEHVFDSPQITTIESNIERDFNGEFSLPITASVTPYFLSQNDGRSPESDPALIQLFDNYGILGARMLQPSADDPFFFSPTWQVPAIAGQVSSSAGPKGLGFHFH